MTNALAIKSYSAEAYADSAKRVIGARARRPAARRPHQKKTKLHRLVHAGHDERHERCERDHLLILFDLWERNLLRADVVGGHLQTEFETAQVPTK